MQDARLLFYLIPSILAALLLAKRRCIQSQTDLRLFMLTSTFLKMARILLIVRKPSI